MHFVCGHLSEIWAIFLCTYKMNQDYFSTPSLHIIISLWRHVSSMPCLVYRQTVDKLFTTSCLCSTDAWFIALMLHRTGIKSKWIHHPVFGFVLDGGGGGGGWFGFVFCFCFPSFLWVCVWQKKKKKSLSITLHQYMSFTTIQTWCHEQNGQEWKKHQVRRKQTFFCPSLVEWTNEVAVKSSDLKQKSTTLVQILTQQINICTFSTFSASSILFPFKYCFLNHRTHELTIKRVAVSIQSKLTQMWLMKITLFTLFNSITKLC